MMGVLESKPRVASVEQPRSNPRHGEHGKTKINFLRALRVSKLRGLDSGEFGD